MFLHPDAARLLGRHRPRCGATKTVLGVSGHRDWLATQCPGNLFAPELDGIRADVARLLATMPVAGPVLT